MQNGVKNLSTPFCKSGEISLQKRGILFAILGKNDLQNTNYKKVTFVAKSERRHIVSDGKRSIRDLILNEKKQIKCALSISDKFFENILIGKGLNLKSIPSEDEIVYLSHDANEGGYFTDHTEDFPESKKEEAIKLSQDLQCYSLGLDVIIDLDGKMWFVDINPINPGIDFFNNLKRAYQTMEHVLNEIINGGGSIFKISYIRVKSIIGLQKTKWTDIDWTFRIFNV